MERPAVQAALRDIFQRWGLPQRLRVDNGYPWGSWGDLPPDLALWLLGLGVEVVWNRLGHAQDNGIVERTQGVSQQWVEPARCANVQVLQARLDWAVTLQREKYPAVRGKSRMAAYPTLRAGGRPYDPATEEQVWDLAPVCRFLEQGLWRRRVDKVGRISLYNRAYYVGRRYAGHEVMVRFDGTAPAWVIVDDRGQVVIRHPAPEISRDRIRALNVSQSKASAHPPAGA